MTAASPSSSAGAVLGRRRAARDRALAARHRPPLGGRERGAAEVAGGRVAVAGRLRERPLDHAVEALGHAGHDLGRPRRGVVQVGQHRRRDGPARVRRLARQRVVEDAAERVDVGARVDLVAGELLGRHEVGGADPVAGGGQAGVGPHRLGEAEVGEVGVLAVEQDVGRLDVAVHEPDGVRGVERGADLEADRRDPGGRDHALAGQQALQVGPVHVAHDEVEVPALLARRVDRDHVRVVDRRGDARLALEALAEPGIARPLGGDQLDGDGPAERQLGRAVDDAHATAAGDRLDAAAGDLGAWEQIGHPPIVTQRHEAAGDGAADGPAPGGATA